MTDTTSEREKTGFIMGDKAYNTARWAVQIVLPAIGAFYFSMAQIWGVFPAAEKVVGTCSVLAVFIGTLIGISSKNYKQAGLGYDGKVITTHTPEGGIVYSLELDEDPAILETKESIAFKVEHDDTGEHSPVMPPGMNIPDPL